MASHLNINAINFLYSNTKSTILTPDGETEHFDILAGILQGDTLAPFLFIIVIDYIMRVSVDTMKETVSSISQEEVLAIQPSTSLMPILQMMLLFFQII